MKSQDILAQTDWKQRRASNPNASAFVAANAGSGKTYVLVTRILRLLLEGVDPSRILALTYTTAAAANMSNRVFKQLSEWVSLETIDLIQELKKLDGTEPSETRIKRARQLFARAVETPGGLKIQTIHAFCERILHVFPFEANVPARFEVLDDRVKEELLKSVRLRILDVQTGLDDPEFASALAELIDITSEYGFEPILAIAREQSDEIIAHAGDYDAIKAITGELARIVGLKSSDTVESIKSEIFNGRLPATAVQQMTKLLVSSTSERDGQRRQAILSAALLEQGPAWEELYFDIFFKTDGDPRTPKDLVTDKFSAQIPLVREQLLAEQSRLIPLLALEKSAKAVSRTRALLIVASAVIRAYEEQKIRRSVLDFKDLITRTRDLLSRAGAQWVLYKLDKGIDHILIDEAQDTSPEQWEILKLLTSEFHDGKGAQLTNRTIFAVGDPKQSIFSFQGAEPTEFSDNRDFFGTKINALGNAGDKEVQSFHNETLTLSFRSAPDILSAVDKVFSIESHFEGLDRDAEPTVHQSKRQNSAGFVELWPPLVFEPSIPAESWTAPLDEPGKGSPAVRLARQIAEHIAYLVSERSSEFVEEQPNILRPIVPGDILILVRKRSLFFETVIRALKDRGLPVAGADRLKLGEHIAVMDLVALGQCVLSPRDDLTLACVLKSPLIGLSENQLMQLAAGRSGSLLDALNSDDRDPNFITAREKLKQFREAANQNGPFAFYSFVLGPCGGRRSFKSRLGNETDDAIDEFLRLAIEHEQRQVPSLLLFLEHFLSSDVTIKRDMDSGRNEVRVMTVHGAKGLEAPIVYLPDTCGAAVDKQKIGPFFKFKSKHNRYAPIWSPSKSTDTKEISELRNEEIKKAAEEHRRLLYVAMTRARDRLYISGYAGKNKIPEDSWYSMIENTLGPSMTDTNGGGSPEGARRFQSIQYPVANPIVFEEKQKDKIKYPEWLWQKPKEEPIAPPPIKPSNAISAADNAEKKSEDKSVRVHRRIGVIIHSLLEILPPVPVERRIAVASNFLNARASDLSQEKRFNLATDTIQLISRPDLAPLFSNNSKAEVSITGTLVRADKPTRRVTGQIDRLAILEKEVLIADFKTTSVPPPSIELISQRTVAQLALYRELVSDLFPSHTIRCYVIYTATFEVREVPVEVLQVALSVIE